jgi:hypothetical protein
MLFRPVEKATSGPVSTMADRAKMLGYARNKRWGKKHCSRTADFLSDDGAIIGRKRLSQGH